MMPRISISHNEASVSDELNPTNSRDFYAHLGAKLGGMTLDGEGPSGALVKNPMRPWEERALTLDAFGYQGVQRLDSQISLEGPTPQEDRIAAIGGTARLEFDSFGATFGLIAERHSGPYRGSPPSAPMPPDPAVAGVADSSPAMGIVQFNELSYVVYPWLVPVLRSELTRIRLDAQHGDGAAYVLRVLPGVATLVRPNLRLTLTGEIDQASGTPPEGTWESTGALVAARTGHDRLQAERIGLSASWGF